jgi:hypothetical protein
MPETIWLTDQNSAAELQARLDAQPKGASVDFVPRREYPGPVVLNEALVLEGGGATLWALVGPVLTVRATVRLRNLRIEVTGDVLTADAGAYAIIVVPGGHLTLENVEVRGLVKGLPQEEGVWHYPHGLTLGGIAPGVPHQWRLSLDVPTVCTIESQISGLKVTPSELCVGVNDLQVQIDALSRDFLIDGHLLLSTAALRRRIAVTAYADESPGAPRGQGQVIWVPPVKCLPPTVEPSTRLARPPDEPIAPSSTPPESSTGATPMPSAPSLEPTPVRRPLGDKAPRLRRDQLPNRLFANMGSLTTRNDPEPSATPSLATLFGEIFQVSDVQPQSQDRPSALSTVQQSPVESDSRSTGNGADHAGQPVTTDTSKTARKQERGVPTQALFDGIDRASISVPIETPSPVAPSPQPSQLEDRDADSKKRRRSASLPVHFGNGFKTPDS